MGGHWKLGGAAAVSLASAVVASFDAAAPASAAVVVSIDAVQVPAGVTAEVGVYASSNAGDVISGFNLPLDINDDGYTAGVLPAGFALDPSPVRSALYANTGFDMPMPQISLIGADGIPTGSGTNVQLGPTPTLLFDLAIDVASTVPAGTVVPLEVFVPPAPFTNLFNVAGPGTPTVAAPAASAPVFGSITVTGVPEPLPAAPAAVATVALARRVRRRPWRRST